MQKTNNVLDKGSEQKKISSLPVWVWVGLGVLAGLFIVLSLGAGFWSFFIIAVVWVALIIFLKKSTLSLTIAIVSVGVVSLFSIFYLTILTGGESNGGAKNTEPLPNLEMTVIKSPEVINCDDEVSNIEVTAKNVGKKSLSFEEVQAGKYDFKICDSNKTEDGMYSCFPLAGGYLSVSDFGVINVGETKNIIFTTPATYDNAITSFSKAKINGEYKYYIDFSQIKNPTLQPTLSKSDLFSVKTNIMNPANEYIKADCRKKK